MPSLFILSLVKGYLLRPTLKQTQFDHCGPSFLPLHTFPLEIILQIADYLDGASVLALHQTSRGLFHIITLQPHHFSPIREARYATAFLRLTHKSKKSCLGYCTSCQELRPLTSFSVSEVMALERLQQASCSRHSRLWMCPHVSYEYESILDLERHSKGYFRIDYHNGFPDCGSGNCYRRFHHRFDSTSTVWPWQPYMKSIITIIRFRNRGGPGTLLDQYQSFIPTAQLKRAIDNLRAPICDHYMLSDEAVRNRYDLTDIDFYSDHWWPPVERGRTFRKSDGFCLFCHALGVHTKFRFAITSAVYRHSDRGDIGFFEVYAILIRSLVVRPSLRKSPDEHRRCHGVAQKKLDQFRDTFPLTQEDLYAYLFED